MNGLGRFRGILLLLVGFALLLAYRRFIVTLPLNSDHMFFVLTGQQVAEGNFTLRHWYMTTVSFGIDIALSALVTRLRGFGPALAYDIPPVLYVLTLGVCVALAVRPWRSAPGRVRLWQGGATLAFLAFPGTETALQVLGVSFHNSTALLILLSLLLLEAGRASDDDSIALGRLFGVAFCLFVATFSDSMALVVGVLPILLAVALRRRRNEWPVAGSAVAAVLLAKLALFLTTKSGGFLIPASATSQLAFTPFERLPENLANVVESLLALSNANFFGLALGVVALLHLCCLGFALVLAVTFRASLRELAHAKKLDFTTTVLTLGALLNIAAYVLSPFPFGLDTLRYLVPFFYYAGVLLGRYGMAIVAPASPNGRMLRACVAVAGLASALLFVFHLATRPRYDLHAMRLAERLRSEGLTHGYGEYWSAAALTGLSRGAVTVRQVTAAGDVVQPMIWGIDARWYRTEPATFVILGRVTPKKVLNDPTSRLPETSVRAALGDPARVIEQEGYTVFVYDRDIAPQVRAHLPADR